MKKNLLSCLVAASLVIGVGLGTVKPLFAEDPEGGEATTTTTKGDDEATTTTTKGDGEATTTTTKGDGEATTTTTKGDGEATTTTTVAATTTVDPESDTAKVAEREEAKKGAESALENAKGKLCDIPASAKVSKAQRQHFESYIEALQKLIDAFKVTDVNDAASMAALKKAAQDVTNLTGVFGTPQYVGESNAAPTDSDLAFTELLIALQQKIDEASDLILAASTDSGESFNKWFGCYTLDQLKKKEHLKNVNVKLLEELVVAAQPFADCTTKANAKMISGKIAELEAQLAPARKCKPVPADPKAPGKPGKPGKSAPALPATGEVATALPLVLFASASVLTALRKKH